MNYRCYNHYYIIVALVKNFWIYRKKEQKQKIHFCSCGKTGIRTLDTVTCITVFETAPIGHSGIFPLPRLPKL